MCVCVTIHAHIEMSALLSILRGVKEEMGDSVCVYVYVCELCCVRLTCIVCATIRVRPSLTHA